MSLNEPIIAEFKQEALTTRKLLERVPLEALGWKPHEKSITMEQLALHIADLLGFLQTFFILEHGHSLKILTQPDSEFLPAQFRPGKDDKSKPDL
jgi:hypothetical protein